MADYYPLLAKAVSGLKTSTPETRSAIYERARKALLGQLRSMQPPAPDSAIDRESRALDEAVARLERELGNVVPETEVAPPAPVEELRLPSVEDDEDARTESFAPPPREAIRRVSDRYSLAAAADGVLAALTSVRKTARD